MNKLALVLWLMAGAAGAGTPAASNVHGIASASDGPSEPAGFALIPAGSFQMGNALSASGDGYSDEVPLQTVHVSEFYMEKNLVTKAQWDEVRAWGLNNGYTDLPMGAGSAPNHPVQAINWYAVVKWCNARSKKEGLSECYTVSGAVYMTYSVNESEVVCNMSASGYRLPTEAEWEKAARGGLSGKRFPWGDTINHSCANYYNSTYFFESPQKAGYHPVYAPGSSPVGSFPANGYGLYDMAGNVWEWCWDRYGSYVSGTVNDPTGPVSGSRRVARGGSWNFGAGLCRVAYRHDCRPSYSSDCIGFRVARSSVPSKP
jgi:formylglycine-generating enzyme required for sulfatase activity